MRNQNPNSIPLWKRKPEHFQSVWLERGADEVCVPSAAILWGFQDLKFEKKKEICTIIFAYILFLLKINSAQQEKHVCLWCNEKEGKQEMFYKWLFGVGHMAKDCSGNEKGNLLLRLRGLLFPVSCKGSFRCTIPVTGYQGQLWSTACIEK